MKLRLVILCLFVSAVTPVVCVAQAESDIQAIRQSYAATNKKLARFKRIKKELSGFSAEGGQMIAYMSGPNIVKIANTYYGEMGRSVEEFYYQDDKLIFVYRKDSTYDRPLSGKVVATTENHYYFKDDKMIRWIHDKGSQIPTTAATFVEKESEYIASSKQFVEGARSKNRVIEDRPQP